MVVDVQAEEDVPAEEDAQAEEDMQADEDVEVEADVQAEIDELADEPAEKEEVLSAASVAKDGDDEVSREQTSEEEDGGWEAFDSDDPEEQAEDIRKQIALLLRMFNSYSQNRERSAETSD